jgi:tRNA nucleotidyltransferase/poly(A) polymerase
LQNHIKVAASLPVERLTEEFLKIISHESRASAFKDLSSIGFLSAVVPELESLKSIPGGSPHHLEGDVWTHTLMVVSEVDSSIEEIEKKTGNRFTKEQSLAIKLAAVFHDVGKGNTVTHDESGNIHYYGHESESALKFEAFCARMKIAKDVSSLASWLIANHLVPFKLLGMRKSKAGEAMYDKRFTALLALSIADALGRFPRQEDFAGKIYRFYSEFLENLKGVKLTTGDDLKRKNTELEGAKFGESLRSIRIAELSKLVPTNDNQ